MKSTIVVASLNPVKIQAARLGFEKMFPGQSFYIQSAAVDSKVSRQPMSDQETYQGAANRALEAELQHPEADYWVGIEGGVAEQNGTMAAFAWIVIMSKAGIGRSRTGAFFLPTQVAKLVRQGKELGEADDLVFNRSNSKQENGAIGILTGDVLNRAALYEQAVIMALVPFKNPQLYLQP